MRGDIVYIIAIRTNGEEDRGRCIRRALLALEGSEVAEQEPRVKPTAAAACVVESPTSWHHSYLTKLGFDWDTANEIFTVASEGSTE